MTISTKARAAALLTAVLVAVPLAQAGPNALDIANLPCSPTCPEELGLAPSEALPTRALGESAGFDWADAAVGFGVGAAILLVAGACGVTSRRPQRWFGAS